MSALPGTSFRHEHARLVAALCRRLGVQHLQPIEDGVQFALMRAVETWPRGGRPARPSAWLYRVALNHVLGELRTGAGRKRLLDQNALQVAPAELDAPEAMLAGEVRDDLLRMLFVCCDDAIPEQAQTVLALRTLCGFDVREIALRLFMSEQNVYKRLTRARQRLRQAPLQLDGPSEPELHARLGAVHRVLYLLFTEGYLSSLAEQAVRRELCDEAIRLCTLLVEHPVGQQPASFALLALMHLHAARLGTRQDASGGLLLLQEQDRSRWDRAQIAVGLGYLERSACGDDFCRYHAEAGIAAEHCLAPSFAETRWDRVAECYALLEQQSPSALHRLNRAVAVAEWQGPDAALRLIGDAAPPGWLQGSYLWSAVLADLHRRAGNAPQAQRHASSALDAAPTDAVRQLLARRLASATG